MRIVKAPEEVNIKKNEYSLFLGGSIEMGKAIDWQNYVSDKLSVQKNLVILNPRRDDWDSSWIQDPTPGTKFYEQVTWELSSQNLADIVLYNFCAGTQSPITLFELGLFATRPNVIVSCPEEFWRYGNVKIVCDQNFIPCFETLDEAIDEIKSIFYECVLE